MGAMMLVLALSIAAAWIFFSAVVTSDYATLTEARREGHYETMETPFLECFPASAHDITVKHDNDNGALWGEFSFDPKDAAFVEAWPTHCPAFLLKVNNARDQAIFKDKPAASR